MKGPVSLAAAVSAGVTTEGEPPPPADPATPEAPKPKHGGRDRRLGLRLHRWLGIPGNRDLFLNTVNWLAQQENLISIRAKDPEDRRITLTPDQDRLIFWLTIFIIPGLILLMGIQAWWRRR